MLWYFNISLKTQLFKLDLNLILSHFYLFIMKTYLINSCYINSPDFIWIQFYNSSPFFLFLLNFAYDTVKVGECTKRQCRKNCKNSIGGSPPVYLHWIFPILLFQNIQFDEMDFFPCLKYQVPKSQFKNPFFWVE